MLRPLSEWRPRQLWTAWIGYWLLVLVVWLAPAIPLLWRVTRTGGHGTMALSASDGTLVVSINSGAQMWTHALSYGALMLFILIPPLLLWVAWLVARPRRVV